MSEKYYEFVNVDYRDTGIDKLIIHVFSKGDEKLRKNPKIKVSNSYGEFINHNSFTININTLTVIKGKVKINNKEFSNVLKWIVLNKKILIKFWRFGGEMITDKFLKNLKKIKRKKKEKLKWKEHTLQKQI